MNTRLWILLAVALLVVAVAISSYMDLKNQNHPKKISRFGKYRGYSDAIYDGNTRVSECLTLADGTRLAYDLFLPTDHGKPVDKPLPVLFKYTPYLRTFTVFNKQGKSNITSLEALTWYEDAMLRVRSWIAPRGNLLDAMFRTKWLGEMVSYGYAVVVVERPGTGASFGKYNPSFEAEAVEADEILNWIATQKWCDGNIGMYGDSIQAQIQFAAASTGNPHLKAIFPASTWMDMYSSVMYPGGIYDKSFGDFYVWAMRLLDSDLITPVDSDKEGALADQARAERRSGQSNFTGGIVLSDYPFRDSPLPSGAQLWDRMALYPYLDKINKSKVPTYLINGWYDIFTRDNFLIYDNLAGPKRLMVRPTDHSNVDDPQADIDYTAEAHRWFDYWLKGIPNGIMDEAPIHYYAMTRGGSGSWQEAIQWPLPNQAMENLYLREGKSGGIASVNDNSLQGTAPTETDASDARVIDYTATTGLKSRWTAVNWAHAYPDMRENDKKGLTYTTDPLPNNVLVVGHPVLHFWLATQAPDADVFVYLEDVEASGSATYITEGRLRASHRALGIPPFSNFGLPFHLDSRLGLLPIPAGQPFEMALDLLPTANRFPGGHRIRLTIVFADAGNFETPVLNPAPTIRVLRDSAHISYLELPVLPAETGGTARDGKDTAVVEL